jgi:hypothetical protein
MLIHYSNIYTYVLYEKNNKISTNMLTFIKKYLTLAVVKYLTYAVMCGFSLPINLSLSSASTAMEQRGRLKDDRMFWERSITTKRVEK